MMVEEPKVVEKKKTLFDKEQQRQLITVALLVALAVFSQINLYGVAAVVAAYFIGMAIQEHGVISTRTIVIKEREKE
jgi:predicted Kef-type K+ transport protein